MEAMKYHLLPERRPMMQSPRTKPRKSTVGALYALGGMNAVKGNRNKLINLGSYSKKKIYSQHSPNYKGGIKAVFKCVSKANFPK